MSRSNSEYYIAPTCRDVHKRAKQFASDALALLVQDNLISDWASDQVLTMVEECVNIAQEHGASNVRRAFDQYIRDDSEIRDLKKQLENRIWELEDEVDKLQKEVARLEKTVESQDQDIEGLKDEIKYYEGVLATL